MRSRAMSIAAICVSFASSSRFLERDLRFDGHAGLEHALPVVERDFETIDQLRAILGRLHVARREFRFRRDVTDGAGRARSAGVGEDSCRLAQAYARRE